MNKNEIENYVTTHGYMVNRALSYISGRLTREEREDASQELYIVMLKCLKNYQPARKTELDIYVQSSLNKRGRGIIRNMWRGANGREYHTWSVFNRVYCDEEYVNFIDTIVSADPLSLEDRELVLSLVNKLPEREKGIMVAWANGETRHEIAMENDLTDGRIGQLIGEAITMLRDYAKEEING